MDIYLYFSETTEKFKKNFKLSPLSTRIDATDSSIDSSLVNIRIHKRIYPITNTEQTFELKFNNKIQPGTIGSRHSPKNDESADIGGRGQLTPAVLIVEQFTAGDARGAVTAMAGLYCSKNKAYVNSANDHQYIE